MGEVPNSMNQVENLPSQEEYYEETPNQVDSVCACKHREYWLTRPVKYCGACSMKLEQD